MKVSDLWGLSKPLTRLVEVVARGTGAVFAPSLTKANARASAEKVKVLAAAMGSASETANLAISYSDETLAIWKNPEQQDFHLENCAPSVRAQSRAAYQKLLRQDNLEQIASVAAQELSGDSEVPVSAPDQDWINRFFRAAEDISSEQMQQLWGRILAGEIRSPGKYSLRTLETVRNLTRADAALIESLARQAMWYRGSAFIPVTDEKWLADNRNLYEGHLFDAGELGICYPTKLAFKLFSEGPEDVIACGSSVLTLIAEQPGSQVHLPIWKFTAVGKELVSLIDSAGDAEQLECVARWLAGRGASAKIGDIIGRQTDSFLVSNERSVHPSSRDPAASA